MKENIYALLKNCFLSLYVWTSKLKYMHVNVWKNSLNPFYFELTTVQIYLFNCRAKQFGSNNYQLNIWHSN